MRVVRVCSVRVVRQEEVERRDVEGWGTLRQGGQELLCEGCSRM